MHSSNRYLVIILYWIFGGQASIVVHLIYNINFYTYQKAFASVV